MIINLYITKKFRRAIKPLLKKYLSLPNELEDLKHEILKNPRLGDEVIQNCYKIKRSIKSKNKGKSGGLRIITFIRETENILTIVFAFVYDKSELSNITKKEIKDIEKEILREDEF